jgi:hypothetical protein
MLMKEVLLKVLDPRTHGFLDYGLAVLFLIMPVLFDFSDTAATLSYVLGVVYIGTSLITRYPLGLFKIVPFPTHGMLETIMAIGFIVFPWLFGFADDAAARNFYVLAGIALLGVVMLTDYHGRGAAAKRDRFIHA